MSLVTMSGAAVVFALQAAQATVSGTVRDGASNNPLDGAIVAMTDLNLSTRADSSGRYAFQRVPAGPHHIAVRALGFAPRTIHALVPTDGVLELSVSLVPTATHLPTLIVRRRVDMRGVERGDAPSLADRRASIAAIRNNPMLIEPDMLLAVSGGDVVVRPESPSGLHVRGGASDHVAYLLDGVPVFSPYHTAGLFSAWNPDAMAAVELSTTMPSPGDLASLSGIVSGITRAPAERLMSQGSISTTHARFAVDGPLGNRGLGILLSVRAGLPRAVAPRREESYVRGETGDRLLKVETPLFGGQLRLLDYESEDDVTTVAVVSDTTKRLSQSPRNAFAWSGRSLGAEWKRAHVGGELRVLGWRASSVSDATWSAVGGPLVMNASRHDAGVLFEAKRMSERSTTMVGARLEQSNTSYHINFLPDSTPDAGLTAWTFIGTAFAQHERTLTHRARVNAGVSMAAFKGKVFAGPRAQLRWDVSDRLLLSSSFSRLHQFAQSLRNQESITGTVFPVELYIGAGGSAVPVARSDQGVLAASYRPSDGLRVSAEAYARRFTGVLLVAPFNDEPFATRTSAIGRGVSRGISVDAAMSAARYGMVASYGIQRVRYTSDRASYVPDHGATQTFEGGVVVHPSPTWSVRFGVTGAVGRRTTAVGGPFEWESCNLGDRGCEFGGSPRTTRDSLGRLSLPAYWRADLGVKKHWHTEIGGRDMVMALFGAATNVFGQKNVLTYATNPTVGSVDPIEMRPRAPLVVGMEWRF